MSRITSDHLWMLFNSRLDFVQFLQDRLLAHDFPLAIAPTYRYLFMSKPEGVFIVLTKASSRPSTVSEKKRLPLPNKTGYVISTTSSTDTVPRVRSAEPMKDIRRQIEAGMNDPLVLYETLKVYLMLGGKAPKVDNDLVVTWMP